MSVTASTPQTIRRTELGAFLRTRRARITQQDVGLPPAPRRRTPGLRREELALLAGVGVTWYTWLEQGRPINASTQVLDAIARVLGLNRTEHLHLYRLADVPGWPDDDRPTCIPDGVQEVLDGMDPIPAAVYNGRWDLLAHNATYGEFFYQLTSATGHERNALWQLFVCSPDVCPMVNREEAVRPMVALLRANFARHLDDPDWLDFVDRLCAASPEFAECWDSHDVADQQARVKLFRDHRTGEVVPLRTVSMSLTGVPEARMIAYVDAGRAAAVANACPEVA